MKRYITRVIFVIFCAAIVLLPLLPRAETEGEYTYAGELAFRESHSEGQWLLCFYSSEGIVAQLQPAQFRDGYWIDFSLTRASALAMPDYDFDHGGTLYYVDSSGAAAVAEGVHHAVTADIESGAYITNLDGDRRLAQLHYYHDGESTCIEPRLCTRLNFGLYISPAISPDGKTIAYCRDNGNGGIVGMLYHKGKSIELGKDIFPIAVSNDMEYLYYGKLSIPSEKTTYEDMMPLTGYYVRSDSGDILIGEGTYAFFRFNRNFSEAIVTASGFSIICTEGGGRLQPFSGFYPAGVIAPQAGLAAELSHGFGSSYSTAYTRIGVDSFIGKEFHCDWGGFAHDVCMGSSCPYHKTAYLDNELQFHIITDNSFALQVAEDGHAALYRLDEELYFIPDLHDYVPGEAVRMSQYCKKFTGSADFSTIYYTNTSNDLYSYSSGARTLLAEDVVLLTPSGALSSTYYDPGMISPRISGSIYFRKLADGSMWRISPAGTVERLSAIPRDAGLHVLGNELLFQVTTDNGTDFYRLDGDTAVKVISVSR